MVARRWRISLLVFNLTSHLYASELHTFREIPYVLVPMHYSLFSLLYIVTSFPSILFVVLTDPIDGNLCQQLLRLNILSSHIKNCLIDLLRVSHHSSHRFLYSKKKAKSSSDAICTNRTTFWYSVKSEMINCDTFTIPLLWLLFTELPPLGFAQFKIQLFLSLWNGIPTGHLLCCTISLA